MAKINFGKLLAGAKSAAKAAPGRARSGMSAGSQAAHKAWASRRAGGAAVKKAVKAAPASARSGVAKGLRKVAGAANRGANRLGASGSVSAKRARRGK